MPWQLIIIIMIHAMTITDNIIAGNIAITITPLSTSSPWSQ